MEAGVPVSFDALAGSMGATRAADRQVLEARLNAMASEGEVVRNRRGDYGAAQRMGLVRGRVAAHRDGYGFVIPEEGGRDLFLAPREMRTLLHGDRVLVRVRGIDARGRAEAGLVEILERSNDRVVGRFFRERGVGFVVPDNKRFHQDVVIPGNWAADAGDGQIVVAEIVEQPTQHSGPVGRIVEVLGEHMAPGLEVEVAIRSHGLPAEWPAEALDEAGEIALHVSAEAAAERLDLRELAFVTIDGPDAKDFDDAVRRW